LHATEELGGGWIASAGKKEKPDGFDHPSGLSLTYTSDGA
jgi:hypothetical protein